MVINVIALVRPVATAIAMLQTKRQTTLDSVRRTATVAMGTCYIFDSVEFLHDLDAYRLVPMVSAKRFMNDIEAIKHYALRAITR